MQNQVRRGRMLGFSALALLQAFLWGVGNPLTKLAYEYIGPFGLLALRFSIAALLFILIFGKRIRRQIGTLQVKGILVTGITMAASYILAYLALAWTTATTMAFLCSLGVVFTPFAARLVLGTRISRGIWPVIAVVTLGLYLLCGGGTFTFGWGEACALLSSLSFAFCLVYSEKHLVDSDPMALASAQCVVASVICWAFALLLERPLDFTGLDARAIGIIVLLAVGCSFLCYLIQNFVLVELPSTLTSLILCSESVFSVVVAYFLLDERLNIFGWIGAALILAGVVLATLIAGRGNNPAQQTAP